MKRVTKWVLTVHTSREQVGANQQIHLVPSSFYSLTIDTEYVFILILNIITILDIM